MALEELKDRLCKCKAGEFFGVARDTIAYAEQLQRDLIQARNDNYNLAGRLLSAERERDELIELARRAHAWIDHGVKTTARVEWCTEFERLLSHIDGGQDD